ncbi:MAG: hypothetical protein AB1507_07755 [Bacillota bacterium]|nr:hypothetical protein [Thermoanaerobacteraceae bacterium]
MKRWLGILGSVLGLAACYWTAVVFLEQHGGFYLFDTAYVGAYTLIFVAALYGTWYRRTRTVLIAGILAATITFLGTATFTTPSLAFIPGSLLVLIAALTAEDESRKKAS